jgi:hypothetical protein
MSTMNEREAALRRALHMAADAVEPSDDGLQFIRARLRQPRPLAMAWAEHIWTDIGLRAPLVLQWWLDKLTAALDELKTASISLWKRFGPTPPGKRRSRTTSWLRPLAALGVFVAIVAVGAYAAIDAQNNLFPSSVSSQNANGTGTGAGGNTNGSGGPNSNSHSQFGTQPPATPSATCSPKPKSSASSSPPSGIISPSTSPSSTPSTTPSVTPTPGVSGATSNSTNAPAAGTSASSGATSTKVTRRARHRRATPSPSPCTTKQPVHRISQPAQSQNGVSGVAAPSPTPTSTPLVVSAGRLNDNN